MPTRSSWCVVACLVAFVVPHPVGAQESAGMSPEASAYLEHVLQIMQDRALNSARVDWDRVRADAFKRAAGAQHTRDTYKAIWVALQALGDHHSRFIPPISELPEQLKMVLAARPAPQPEGRRLSGTVGYIRVPAFSMLFRDADPDDFARQILDLIHQADGPEICGWVVDVRGNTGGNMWPMLQGLHPILGDAVPGYFVSRQGERQPWVVDMSDLAPRALARPDPPVAVLQDSATASSGEAVVVAFRGRPETRSFGQPTNGLSTSNDDIQMSDGAMMILTVAAFADREGHVYGGRIQPDELLPDTTTDQDVLRAATDWLGRQPGCGGG